MTTPLRVIRSPLAAAIAVSLFLVSAPAAAQAPGDARAHFGRGETAYRQGDYDAAIREWTAAYQLDPRPLIQFNLAQAYERMGRLEDAARALDNYLQAADPSDPQQGDARARRAALQQRLSRTGVTVSDAPDGAAILIDGTEWGRTPRPDPIRIAPGGHQIVLRLDGYEDFNATIVVPAGETIAVSAVMQQAAPVAGPSEGSGSQPDPEPTEAGGSVWPYVLLGAGGAFAAFGAVFGLLAVGAANDAPSADSDEAKGAKALAALADVSFVLALGAAGTGLVLLMLDDDGAEEGPTDTALRVTPIVGPGVAGAAASVRF